MKDHTLLSTHTIGHLVAERPERARVFERYGMDYCCGGRKSLAVTCADKGLDLARVISELETSDAAPAATDGPDWTTASLSSLAAHIQEVHHEFLSRELPRLGALVQKVTSVHGTAHPELERLATIFSEFARDLAEHMLKEETVLFPWVRAIEGAHDRASLGRLDEPIRRMMREHDDAGGALAAMRDLTRGFTPPAGACGTYRVMLSGLAALEADMHMHVHKENNILFPRALALQGCGCATSPRTIDLPPAGGRQ